MISENVVANAWYSDNASGNPSQIQQKILIDFAITKNIPRMLSCVESLPEHNLLQRFETTRNEENIYR